MTAIPDCSQRLPRRGSVPRSHPARSRGCSSRSHKACALTVRGLPARSRTRHSTICNPTVMHRAARPRPSSISLVDRNGSRGSFSRPWTGSASTRTTLDLSGRFSQTRPPEKILDGVYEDNYIDCVMQHAEVQAALNDVCAVQVKCTNDPDKPVDLQLWGADEFTVFTDPEDPRKTFAVCTIDAVDRNTRYRVWFADEIYTYVTNRYGVDSGRRIIVPGEKTPVDEALLQKGSPEVNTYGCIPFAFLHYRAPIRQFWTPGPGTFLRKAELRINDRLSELDELIGKYGRPIGVFKNVSPTFTPEIGPGRFMRLCRGGTGYTGEGYADGGDPAAEYLQAQLAIESIWVNLEKYMKQVATAVNLPYSSLELQYEDASSGIAHHHQVVPAHDPCQAAHVPSTSSRRWTWPEPS